MNIQRTGMCREWTLYIFFFNKKLKTNKQTKKQAKTILSWC